LENLHKYVSHILLFDRNQPSYLMIHYSEKLENVLSSQITRAKGEIRTDMLMWLNRTTLEIIGLAGILLTWSDTQSTKIQFLAGFAYNFDVLSDSEPGELDSSLSELLKAGSTPFAILQATIPILRAIVSVLFIFLGSLA
jgi:hypothetical protein